MSTPIYKSEEFIGVVVGLLSYAATEADIPANLPTNPDAQALVAIVKQIVAAKGNFGVIVTTLLGAASEIYGIVQKIEGEINPPTPTPAKS